MEGIGAIRKKRGKGSCRWKVDQMMCKWKDSLLVDTDGTYQGFRKKVC